MMIAHNIKMENFYRYLYQKRLILISFYDLSTYIQLTSKQ